MKRTLLSSLVLGPALLLAALLSPVTAAAAGPIVPSAACAAVGTDVTCNLYAKTGTISLPGGGSTTIWGYAITAGASPTVPGPVLVVNQGDQVTVNLINSLPRPSSVLFGGMAMVPDTTGAAAGGGTTSYAFTADQPGTYLYEAGLIPGEEYQPAMGLYGAIVVRPSGAAGQAFGDASTAFDDEALVVLGEIDPALTGSGSPWTFDLRGYAPRWFLVNGAPYSASAPAITTTGGNALLLRYVNAGIQHHSIGVLGLHQRVLSIDGSELPAPRTMIAETIAPGQAADVLVDVPATAATTTSYALYDAALFMNNSNATGMGGMLAFIDASGAPDGDTVGPITSNVTLADAGGGTYTLTADTDDTSTGGAPIAAAEYRLDSTGATPVAMAAADGAFDTATESVTSAVGEIDTTGWTSGTHTVYVRGQDNLGNWGSFASTTLTIDVTGPVVSGLTLAPATSDGSVPVALAGTASDATTGNNNVVAAEYFIGATGADGAGTAMSLNQTAPTVAITATIPAGNAGEISVHAQDAAGNWGAFTTITLGTDAVGPATSGVSASPNPNNGTLPLNGSNPSVRVTASFDDTATGNSLITGAEGFIDAIGANGSGFPFAAADGFFNATTENGYADIPLTTVAQLSAGDHTIYVHGKDAAGNWGATSSTILTVDKTPPAVGSITLAGSSPTNAPSVSWQVTFSEAVVGVTSANFGLARGSGLTGGSITSVTGGGTTWTVTASNWSNGGTLGLNLTSASGIRDVAGNNLPAAGLPVVGPAYDIQTPLDFSTAGNTLPPGVGGTADDADIYRWNGTAFSRAISATTDLGLPGGANVDGFDRVDATHFYLSFNGNVSVPGLGTVADEDVVYYDAGTWSLFFDGSVAGVGNTDLDAISVVGGTLYFSTDNTAVPTGVTGGGDDADIYSWNGSSFARVYDASALGWSTANVDGFVRVDSTHFYASYSADTTVPGLGTVQDEDVVFYNDGTWSVYFDGTAKGLTSNAQDVDAFDLP
jgi:FtsP/CotA-like multicopper oxidase with cupredoxin domain